MHWSNLIDSEYLSAESFEGRRHTFTIAGIEFAQLQSLENVKSTQRKAILVFRETKKHAKTEHFKTVLSKTNILCLKALFGPDTDGWVGKRVVLHSVTGQQGLKRGMAGIRVYGSPDISEPVTVTCDYPKKSPFDVTMVPTGKTKPEPVPDAIDPERMTQHASIRSGSQNPGEGL